MHSSARGPVPGPRSASLLPIAELTVVERLEPVLSLGEHIVQTGHRAGRRGMDGRFRELRRPTPSRLRRRQPLLRGARRLHPPPRPGAGAPVRAVVRDRRPPLPRARRAGEPRRHQPHVRPRSPSPAPCTTTSGATPTDATRWRCLRRPRADPPRVPGAGARSERLDEQGLAGLLAVPDAGHDLRGAAEGRSRGGVPTFRAFNRWLRGGLGLRLRGPHLRRALPDPGRPGVGRRGADVGPRPRRPHHRHAPGGADHRARAALAVRPDVRRLLGPRQRGRRDRRPARRRRRACRPTASRRRVRRQLRAGLEALDQVVRHRAGHRRLPASRWCSTTTS